MKQGVRDFYFFSAGSADFMGINHYSSVRARHRVCSPGEVGYYCDMDVEADRDPAWPGYAAGLYVPG